MDPFTRLGVEKRLTLTEEELREAFRAAGKAQHPDAGGSNEDFSKLQEAFQLLCSPSKRLRAWLAANEISGEERGSISADLVDLFGVVGGVLQRADALTKKRNATLSALTKAMLEPQVQEAREELEVALEKVSAAFQAQEQSFAVIENGAADPWRTLRDLAFLEKWRAELKNRFAGLW